MGRQLPPHRLRINDTTLRATRLSRLYTESRQDPLGPPAGAWAPRGPLTRSFTWVLFRCHFSLGFEGVNTETSLPSSSKMLELSCLMTWGGQEGQEAGSSRASCPRGERPAARELEMGSREGFRRHFSTTTLHPLLPPIHVYPMTAHTPHLSFLHPAGSGLRGSEGRPPTVLIHETGPRLSAAG